MAGSYDHIVTDQGNLRSNERVVSSLETGSDVFEAIEEMYGMIWYLAKGWVGLGLFPSEGGHEAMVAYCDQVKRVVAQSQTNYKEGLGISKTVHALSPDTRREE